MSRAPAFASSLVLALAIATPASGHDVETYLSPSGLQFLSDNLADHVPDQMSVKEISYELYECDGKPNATVTQEDTTIDLDVQWVRLTQPEAGTLRMKMRFSANAVGKAHFENHFFCAGDTMCNDSLSIQDATVTVDLRAAKDEDGKLRFLVNKTSLDVSTNDVEATLTDCSFETLGTELIGVVKQLALKSAIAMAEEIAEQRMGQVLDNVVAGFTRTDLDLGLFEMTAELTNIDLRAGIRVQGDLDLDSELPPASCLTDPGEPAPHPGRRPTLSSAHHFGMSVNLGLIDDLLYQAWSASTRCESVAIDASFVADYLDNFPAGTSWRMTATLEQPPRVEGTASTDLQIDVVIPGIALTLTATLPDGSTRTARGVLEARAHTAAWLDSSKNALGLELMSTEVSKLNLEDELGLAALGFDGEKIRQLINDVYLPGSLSNLFGSQAAVPLGIGYGGYYGILREVRSTNSHLIIGADLFRAPESDTVAPDTRIESAPSGPIRPQDAVIYVSGTDDKIPSELLHYQFSLDGVDHGVSPLSALRIGYVGITSTYRLDVAAVDLAGNVDASPATVQVTVDGIRPKMRLLRFPHDGATDDKTPRFEFEVSDDLTPTSQLRTRFRIYELTADGEKFLREQDLGAGTTSAQVQSLQEGKTYRVAVIVSDEAGNEGVEGVVFTVTAGGGCSVGGRGGLDSGLSVLFILGVFGLWTRRRRHAGAALLAVLVASTGCDSGGEIPDPDDEIRALPSCSSDLGRSIWSAMNSVAYNSTVPMDRALGIGTLVDSKVYISGPEIFGKMADLIGTAEREVSMQFYKWEPDTDATETLLGGVKAIENRRLAQRSTAPPVKIYLVIDTSALGTAAPRTEEHLPLIMQQIDSYKFDDYHIDITVAFIERGLINQFGNLHVKMVVIDSRVAMITGANPEHQHNFDAPWHDMGNVFRGDIVDGMLADFDYTWSMATEWICPVGFNDPELCIQPAHGFDHQTMPYQAAPSNMSACAAMTMTRTPALFTNNNVDNPQDQGFLAAFGSAKHTLKLETPNFNDDAVKAAVIEAIQRGVIVKLITSKGFNEIAEQPAGGGNETNVSALYAELAVRGVQNVCDKFQVRWYSHDGKAPLLGNAPYASHVKYTSVDDQVVIVGTTNMDTASWNFSHEFNVAIDDASVTREYDRQLFDADWDRAIVADECAR